MSTTVSCPHCGAAMRAEQSWCSLCYAQVSEPFDPLTAPFEVVVELTADPAVSDATPTERAQITEQSWVGEGEPVSAWVDDGSPRVAPPVPSGIAPTPGTPAGTDEAIELSPAGETPETAETQEVSDIDVMLSMLAAEHRAMDPASALTDRFEDKSTRIAIMVGGTVVIGAVLFVTLTVLGAIF